MWPHHLKPLPSFLADPFLYYITLEYLSSPQIYFSILNKIKLEIGTGEKFGRLFAHISHDVCDRILDNTTLADKESYQRKAAEKFLVKLIEDNHLEYQESLKQKVAQFISKDWLSMILMRLCLVNSLLVKLY